MSIDGDLCILMEYGTLSREGGLQAQMDPVTSQCADHHHDCCGIMGRLKAINISGNVGCSGDTGISEARGIPGAMGISRATGISEDISISGAMGFSGEMGRSLEDTDMGQLGGFHPHKSQLASQKGS